MLGGLAIGLTAFWNARLNGTVTGISGELGKALSGNAASTAFVTGLISAGIILKHIIPTPFTTDLLRHVPISTTLLAGFLVGFGTKLGNGCTSGHGVCGLSRFSVRSLVSTITFMVTAMLTATLFSSLSRYRSPTDNTRLSQKQIALPPSTEFPWMLLILVLAFALPSILAVICQYTRKDSDCKLLLKQSIQYVLGMCFGGGLIISGMAMPSKTVAFLDLGSGAWDPSLLFVFVGALPIAIAGFRPIMHGTRPILTNFHSLPTRTDIDAKLVAGASLFGVGWGLLGLCPGPALVYLGAFPFTRNILAFCGTLAAGNFVGKRLT